MSRASTLSGFTTAIGAPTNLNVGVLTAKSLTLLSGTVSYENLDITGLTTTTNLFVAGVSTFNGNVSIAGTLTYEDVTNIDSVGIITAQAGIHVTGGSVGVGTNNPAHKLDVRGTGVVANIKSTNNNYALQFAGNDCAYDVYVGSDSANNFLLANENNDGTFTERLRITSNGKVVISTNSSQSAAHDYAGVYFSSDNSTVAEGLFLNNVAANTGDNVSLSFSTDSGNRKKSAISHVDTGNYGRGDLTFSIDPDADSGELDIVAHEKLRITSTGRVGVGHTDPFTQFFVNDNASLGGIYNGKIEGSVNNNSGLILLHKLGEGQGFYFAGDIIVMSWTGQAKIDCILSATYNNDTIGWNVRDNGTGGTNMVTKSTVKYGTVTYDGGTWLCLKKDGGGSGVMRLNGFLGSNAASHLPARVQTLEITSGYSSFSSSVTLN